jgi:hypothetical protein
MNPLEKPLRSWKPRRASARLERGLFGRPPRQSALALPWLAPALACGLWALMIVNPHNTGGLVAESAEGKSMAALSLSNQSYAAYLPGSFTMDQNRWDTFRWTNTSVFRSSRGPFLRH